MKVTKVLVDELYPKIATNMSKNLNKYKKCVADFISKRSKSLYDTCPCDAIYFGAEDAEDFYKAIGITEKEINNILRKTYYYSIPNFNPRAAKDEFTVAQMMVIRYFYLKNMKKELEISTIYLAFSGKFYPSIHYGSYPQVKPSEYRYIMEYVINNSLSNKYDIKREGSVFGAVKSICNTWLRTYDSKLRNCDDEDVVYLIQQLHNRLKSFMKNIASLYYKVYQNKDAYFVYDSDSEDKETYRIADNDSLKIERATEKSMEYIINTGVDYKLCKTASDSNVKTDEVKGIIEAITSDSINIPKIKELIRLIITDFFQNNKERDLSDIVFISYSITPKPNTKNTNIIKEKQIIEDFLDNNSSAYRRRKSRDATKNSYFKSVLTYFVLIIHNNNK